MAAPTSGLRHTQNQPNYTSPSTEELTLLKKRSSLAKKGICCGISGLATIVAGLISALFTGGIGLALVPVGCALFYKGYRDINKAGKVSDQLLEMTKERIQLQNQPAHQVTMGGRYAEPITP